MILASYLWSDQNPDPKRSVDLTSTQILQELKSDSSRILIENYD